MCRCVLCRRPLPLPVKYAPIYCAREDCYLCRVGLVSAGRAGLRTWGVVNPALRLGAPGRKTFLQRVPRVTSRKVRALRAAEGAIRCCERWKADCSRRKERLVKRDVVGRKEGECAILSTEDIQTIDLENWTASTDPPLLLAVLRRGNRLLSIP
jgi:hypothetical protein